MSDPDFIATRGMRNEDDLEGGRGLCLLLHGAVGGVTASLQAWPTV